MDRILLDQLHKCLGALRIREDALRSYLVQKEKLAALRRPPSERTYNGGRFSIGAFAAVLGAGIFALQTPLGLKIGFNYPWWLLGSLVLSVICGMVFGRISASKKAEQLCRENKLLAEKHADELRRLEPSASADFEKSRQQLNRAVQDVQRYGKLCGIHEKYLETAAVQAFISYLETGRCDSLKEAINLYEQEQREQERDQAAAAHRRIMQEKADAIYSEALRSAEAAENAARSAETAACFGVASMLAAANKKPKDDNDFRVV